MSGYVEVKIRTVNGLSTKFVDGLLSELSSVLQSAGHAGSVKCTNTGKEVKFDRTEDKPKLKPVKESKDE